MATALRSGLALVDVGWTGTVSTTIGAVVAAVQPQERMSAAQVWRFLMRESTRVHGGTWTGYVDSADKLYLQSTTAAFTLAATGTTQTRLGLTGTYTGATSYTADATHYGVVTPSLGLSLEAGRRGWGTMRPAADGSLGFGGMRATGSGSLVCHGTYAELEGLEATLIAANVYDVWLDGRLQGRVHLGNASRTPLGMHTSKQTLTVDVREVTS